MSMNKRILQTAVLLVMATAAAADTPAFRPTTQWSKTESLWRSEAYLYDGAGNIIAVGTDSYRYDAAGRLIHAVADVPLGSENEQGFAYDVYGNMTGMTTSVDGAPLAYGFAVNPSTNQLTGTCPPNVVGCFKGFYDEAGNQTGGATNGEYAWDPLGSLGELKGGRHERYLYDANDERIAVIRYDPSTTIELERRYTLRGIDQRVARELTYNTLTSTWSLTKDYVLRDGRLIAAYSGSDTSPSRHYHTDHLGSTRLVTDGAGYKLAIHTYWPFGVEAPGSQADAERLKFTGHERDSNPLLPGWDLDYMHARYYSPVTARFLSLDPARSAKAEVPQSWNRYLYAFNSPINYLDPDGRDPKAYLLVTGKRLDLFRHSAIYIRDTAPNQRLDLVYSHGGQASGVSPLRKYLGAYNPTKDPTVAYELKLTTAEVNQLKQRLDSNYTITNGHFVSNQEYDGVTNNCAQATCDAILESADLNLAQQGAANYMTAGGYPYVTFQLLEILWVLDLADLETVDMDVLDAEENQP